MRVVEKFQAHVYMRIAGDSSPAGPIRLVRGPNNEVEFDTYKEAVEVLNIELLASLELDMKMRHEVRHTYYGKVEKFFKVEVTH